MGWTERWYKNRSDNYGLEDKLENERVEQGGIQAVAGDWYQVG